MSIVVHFCFINTFKEECNLKKKIITIELENFYKFVGTQLT